MTKKPLSRIAVYTALVVLSLVFLLPFAWMVSSSLKDTAQIFQFPPSLIPSPVHAENYGQALTFIPFLRYLGNTLLVCAGNMVGNALSCSLVAYSFSVLRWRGRESFFKLLLASMLLPPQVTMIPVFMIWRLFGMVDSFWPLVLPAFFGTPFFIFMLRQFFLGIPRELVEAARIDGCGEWTVYWRIVLPLARPALATVMLFSFIWAWTDFLTPLIYLQDQKLFTLSLGLQQFQESHGAEWGMLMAASTMMTLPMIALFFAAQKQFVEGIVTTGLKG